MKKVAGAVLIVGAAMSLSVMFLAVAFYTAHENPRPTTITEQFIASAGWMPTAISSFLVIIGLSLLFGRDRPAE